MPTYTTKQAVEFGLLVLLVGREAMNQPTVARTAVAWSVSNRLQTVSAIPNFWNWGRDWCSVIEAKNAYTSIEGRGDPNLIKYPDLSDPHWLDCVAAAESAYWRTGDDLSNGAVSYFDKSLDADPPDWSKSKFLEHCGDIGSFHFFRLLKARSA